MTKIYMAPLEGVTGYIFRRAYHETINPHMDGYMTPFISPNQNSCMNTREKKDVDPANNEGLNVVPQILTKSAERFVETTEILKKMGYQEVNLNLGCPAPTVTTKKKGAAMLGDLAYLESFLDEIFEKTTLPVSIKTRLGIEDAKEWIPLLELYKKYPVKNLIIHARLLKDFYTNIPNLEAVKWAKENCDIPLCYNGDIFSLKDYERVHDRLGDEVDVMLGRGLLRNPFLTVAIMQKQKRIEADNLDKKRKWKFFGHFMTGL